jgi:hypothetical protein
LIVVQIFWNQLSTYFSQFKSCVTICWTIHSLTLSLSAIIRIVKHLLWRKRALIQSMFVFCLTEARRPDCSASSNISRRFTKSSCDRNT